MSAQAPPLLAPALSAAHGLDRRPPGELGAGGRRSGPIAFHCRALGLVVLIHALALAACLASRSEAALGIANRASESVTVTLIQPMERLAPPTPPALRRQEDSPEHEALARREEQAITSIQAPALARSEATDEVPAAAQPQSAPPQTAATPAPLLRPATPQAPREVSQLSCEVPEPEYPERSKRRGESGRVVMRIAIDERGVVSQTRLVRSSGYPALDQAAQRAALQARCAPYIENGKALAVSALQSFKFEWAE